MKRVNITTAVLLIYLLVMSVIGWPGKQVSPDYIQYACVIGFSLVLILALRFLLIKRMRMREKYKNNKDV